jgi:hypothetical protein
MKKVYVKIEVRAIIRMDEGEEVSSVLENMDYDFTASPNDNADIEDTEITDWEVVDSK